MSSRPVALPPTTRHRLGDGALVGTVYQCVDGDGRTLYVGQSIRLVKRFNTHRCRSIWWPHVAAIYLYEVRDSRPLDEVERQVIGETRPLHNRLHNPDWEWSYDHQTWVPVGTSRDYFAYTHETFRRAIGHSLRAGRYTPEEAADLIARSRARQSVPS